MGRSIDDILKELYSIDKEDNYEISYFCGRWVIQNWKTSEGIDTDAGFQKAKRWLLKDMEKSNHIEFVRETNGLIQKAYNNLKKRGYSYQLTTCYYILLNILNKKGEEALNEYVNTVEIDGKQLPACFVMR